MNGPTRDEAADAGHIGGLWKNKNLQSNCAALAFFEQARSNDFARLQALYALASHELIRLDDGTLIARRWRLLKALDSLSHAEAFLRQVTGGQQ